MAVSWVVVWLSMALWMSTARCCVSSCSNNVSIGIKVINTRNNASQWSTEVKLENENEVNIGTTKWNVQIDQINTFQCAGTMEFTDTLEVPPAREVPGYDYIAGVGYYKIHPPGKVWEEARRTCVREGGHLAIINSETEATTLQLMFAKTSSQKPYAFIGFHDHYTEGDFMTVYDVPLKKTGFYRWGAGQPDNVGAGGENCGSIYRVDGSLNDIGCGLNDWPFICEQEL